MLATIAQLVEHLFCNQAVGNSSFSRSTIFVDRSKDKFYYTFYQQGVADYNSGLSIADRRYQLDSVQHKYWLMGFKDAPWQQ